MSTVVMNVPDISCAHCERAITTALAPLEGIHAVRVDIPVRQVHVNYDTDVIGTERIQQILADEEYPVASVA